jgi:hypothetical protein
MKENFEKWIDFCFFHECGSKGEPRWKHEVPGDPGGLTIYGISRKAHPHDIELMKEMDKPEARVHAARIAKGEYWDRLDCDDLPHGMDIVIADIAFNQGEGRAKEIRPCAIDWRDASILRIDKYDDLQQLFTRFGSGWAKRLVSLRDYIVSNFTILEWDRKELINGNLYKGPG